LWASDILYDENIINRLLTGLEVVVKPLIDEEIEEINEVSDKEQVETQETPAISLWDKEVPTVVASSLTEEEESSRIPILCNCGSDSDMQKELLMIMLTTNELSQPSLTPPMIVHESKGSVGLTRNW
jgi:hypothetical protein